MGMRAPRSVAIVLVGALMAAAGVSAYLLVSDDRSETAGSNAPPMPALFGMEYEDASAALDALGLYREHEVVYRAIANASVPVNRVAGQEPAAGNPLPKPGADIVLEFSAGGPTITFAQLPARAKSLTKTLEFYDPTEPILVTTTANGVAYKTDAWLFGPCPAVDAAYRTFQDPRYDDNCY